MFIPHCVSMVRNKEREKVFNEKNHFSGWTAFKDVSVGETVTLFNHTFVLFCLLWQEECWWKTPRRILLSASRLSSLGDSPSLVVTLLFSVTSSWHIVCLSDNGNQVRREKSKVSQTERTERALAIPQLVKKKERKSRTIRSGYIKRDCKEKDKTGWNMSLPTNSVFLAPSDRSFKVRNGNICGSPCAVNRPIDIVQKRRR